jgi:hypothetical protein
MDTEETTEVQQEVTEPVVEQTTEVTEPVEAVVPEKDYKELLSDYTRKSQELAAIKQSAQPKEEAPPVELPWQKDQAWDAKTYDELAEPLLAKAEERVWKKIIEESEREENEAKQIEQFVEQEATQLKQIDPNVNINQVLAHAQKYAFASLIPAYQNMKAMEDAARLVEERVLKNLKARSGEPVGSGSGQGSQTVVFPPEVKTGLEKARWLIRNPQT